MSERLTAEQLVDLERWAADDLRGDEQRQVWSAVEEIRERRALDLSQEDRLALRDAQRCIRHHFTSVGSNDKHHNAAIRVLDRLLNGGGR
jgi:hypothetical protein